MADAALDPCPWCGAPLPPARERAWHVVRCPACRVGVTRPWPTPEELDAAYPTAYRPQGGRFGGPGDAILRLSRGTLARRIDGHAPPGPVLDVGAGDGTLVRALERRGRRARGLERDDPEPWELPPDETYAAIVLWHSLEHLPQPARALEALAARLVPGGLLVVAVPNLDSLQSRVFGARWLALDLPRHLTHLPARALAARLTLLGLDVERESAWRGGQVVFGWLHGLVAALPGRPDLYDAIRRGEAQLHDQPPAARRRALALAPLLLPVACVLSALEVLLRRGGSAYVEGRREGRRGHAGAQRREDARADL